MKSQGFIFNIQEKGLNNYDFFYHKDDPKEYRIGRASKKAGFDDVNVHLRDKTVSRNHCRIFNHPSAGWLVEDLGSTNGTWIKRDAGSLEPFKRVTKATSINPYSELRLGDTAMKLRSLPSKKEIARDLATDNFHPAQMSA